MENNYILEAVDVSFEYTDGTKALDNINMKICKGQKTVILGPNGAGKTTLFLLFNGILKPKSGKIMFNNKEVKYSRKEIEKLRKNVGIVFQNPDIQIFANRVYQEISFGLMNLGMPEDLVREKIEKVLMQMDITDIKDKPTHFLSYGQKKSVSIADIIVMEPEVIILDEPTVYLDYEHVSKIIKTLDDLISQGKTIVLSTHDVDFAYSWADYVYLMKDGKVIDEGKPIDIFSDENKIKKVNLRRPMIMDVFEILRERSIVNCNIIPKNVEELKNCLK
ncbi:MULTISPECIES: energy-coupling factor ABC transporter ATP-binding protein [Thermoanaerobacterium]|uniref:ABC transporter ATP-binding protein n=2 Tax=Thermoanaerobacterium TaxID=28895 RepID=W9ECS1_9THEO|nr:MULTISPECIES: ATP-binding cassette domain-containing protein [Thermoanaerobacterium]AFK87629.1 cobalt ABC transporter, ATPase subunit [Thermoanaerobacterium saccharolyticum JW/SL-YS485]ETO37564.1 cobalt ABC transporter ATPase [Thermoanaerobacterium aotearoense SCUT27]